MHFVTGSDLLPHSTDSTVPVPILALMPSGISYLPGNYWKFPEFPGSLQKAVNACIIEFGLFTGPLYSFWPNNCLLSSTKFLNLLRKFLKTPEFLGIPVRRELGCAWTVSSQRLVLSAHAWIRTHLRSCHAVPQVPIDARGRALAPTLTENEIHHRHAILPKVHTVVNMQSQTCKPPQTLQSYSYDDPE